MVENSIGIVTALNPMIGYENASKVAKMALTDNRSVRDIIVELELMSGQDFDRVLLKLLTQK